MLQFVQTLSNNYQIKMEIALTPSNWLIYVTLVCNLQWGGLAA